MRRFASRAARTVVLCASLAAAIGGPGAVSGSAVFQRAAAADEGWLPEFEAVCSKTQDAMALPSDELRSLVTRCDQPKPAIDALEPSRKKVYGKRLALCRNLYEFVLQTREKDRQ
jgi:hypothetical protein